MGKSPGGVTPQPFVEKWSRSERGASHKRKYDDLSDAYRQLLQYGEAPDNPPVLIVGERDRTA